jgi:hypothetical protein
MIILEINGIRVPLIDIGSDKIAKQVLTAVRTAKKNYPNRSRVLFIGVPITGENRNERKDIPLNALDLSCFPLPISAEEAQANVAAGRKGVRDSEAYIAQLGEHESTVYCELRREPNVFEVYCAPFNEIVREEAWSPQEKVKALVVICPLGLNGLLCAMHACGVRYPAALFSVFRHDMFAICSGRAHLESLDSMLLDMIAACRSHTVAEQLPIKKIGSLYLHFVKAVQGDKAARVALYDEVTDGIFEGLRDAREELVEQSQQQQKTGAPETFADLIKAG